MFIASPMLETLSQIETKLNLIVANDALSSLYAWQAFDISGKLFVRKQYNIWIFLILSQTVWKCQ